jgi:hypothetical protein
LSSLIRKPLNDALIFATQRHKCGADVESLDRSLSTDVNPLNPDLGGKRRPSEVETQSAPGPGIHTVGGFKEDTSQADVEQSDRYWKRQYR